MALVQPYISYGILTWGNANSSVLQKVVLLQKRAIRIINNANFNDHTEPLFKHSEILRLNDLYEYQVCLFMHDFLNKKLPQSFDGMFRLNSDIQTEHVTRQSDHMNVPRCTSALSGKLPIFNFPIIWNKWSPSLSTCKSISQTKKILKNLILDKYAASLKCNSPYCRQCRN